MRHCVVASQWLGSPIPVTGCDKGDNCQNGHCSKDSCFHMLLSNRFGFQSEYVRYSLFSTR